MRIRFKKWARPELEASKFYIDEPEKYKSEWRKLFENEFPRSGAGDVDRKSVV